MEICQVQERRKEKVARILEREEEYEEKESQKSVFGIAAPDNPHLPHTPSSDTLVLLLDGPTACTFSLPAVHI